MTQLIDGKVCQFGVCFVLLNTFCWTISSFNCELIEILIEKVLDLILNFSPHRWWTAEPCCFSTSKTFQMKSRCLWISPSTLFTVIQNKFYFLLYSIHFEPRKSFFFENKPPLKILAWKMKLLKERKKKNQNYTKAI